LQFFRQILNHVRPDADLDFRPILRGETVRRENGAGQQKCQSENTTLPCHTIPPEWFDKSVKGHVLGSH
jgi:hypothetical protein